MMYYYLDSYLPLRHLFAGHEVVRFHFVVMRKEILIPKKNKALN